MTNEEILKKAVEKAVRNGYGFPKGRPSHYRWVMPEQSGYDYIFLIVAYEAEFHVRNYTLFDIIFSHQFAKAFWGEETINDMAVIYHDTPKIAHPKPLPAWAYHLTRMVLQEDPIKYLEQFLK